MTEQQDLSWLLRRSTIRKLWIGFALVLAALIVAGAVIDMHPHFAVEAVLGFNAWYGLGSCVVLVVLGRVAALLLQRREDYYDAD